MKRRSSYKSTFFDRHGPDGEFRLKAIGYGVLVFGVVTGASLLAGTIGGMNMLRPVPLLVTLLAAVTLGYGTMRGGLGIIDKAGDATRYFTAGGSSTPYEDQFSEEQSLVMKRDYATALALFEHRITMAPGEPRVRIAAADLYRTYGENPRRAADLYREVQRMPEVTMGNDVYVSNKLADLYLGPLKEPGKALVEFRRLIERYPGSTTASHAKLALANLKSDIMNEDKGAPAPNPPW
jgi:hypothetical protein